MMKGYPFYKNKPVNSITEIIIRSKNLYGESIAIKYKKKKKIYEKSYNDLYNDSVCVAMRLMKMNLKNGHVAIIGASSYEWLISYFGIVFAGLVAVPIDKELSLNDIEKLFKIADIDCVLYGDDYFDCIQSVRSGSSNTIPFSDLLSTNVKDISLPKIDPNKMSAIVFTSGTTGNPKGVTLTQKNIANNVVQGLGAIDLQHDKDIDLSILPLNHTYEFTGLLMMIYKGVLICISSGIKYLQKEFLEYKPTVMYSVPLIVETLYKNILKTAKTQHKDKALKMLIRVSSGLMRCGIDLRNKLFKSVISAFGGQLKTIMCGGAALDESLVVNYQNIGINLIQGYGLTECSPLLSANLDYYHRPNSVGKIVDGNYVKIVDDEIWAKGVSVSSGYYNNVKETICAFEDGWFKTGDLGYVDDDNFLFITGRKKNLIILSNGENISAEEIESYVYSIPYVSEVIASGKNDVISIEVFLEEDADKNSFEKDIAELNKTLPLTKNIGNISYRDTEFPKTTTKKIIRNYIEV